jgi:hypothetical protein
MADIFLSYSKQDAEHARTLAEALLREGVSVWWDHHIPPGRSWAEVIEREIGNAACVVVLWSQSSVRSQWVQNEAREGLSRDVLLPVIADRAVQPPLEFRHVQAAYLHEWDLDDERSEYTQLVTSVRDVLHRDMALPSPTEPAAPPLPSRRAPKWSWIAALVLLLVLALGVWLWPAARPSSTSAGQVVEHPNVGIRTAPRIIPGIHRRSVDPPAMTSTAPLVRLDGNVIDPPGRKPTKWNVHLQIPTSMTSAEVRVDGEKASIVNRVASMITVEIPVGNEDHEFRINSPGKRP